MVKHIIHNEESDEPVIEWRLHKVGGRLFLQVNSTDLGWITILSFLSTGSLNKRKIEGEVPGMAIDKNSFVKIAEDD